MVGKIAQTKKIFVETEYDNIIVVNPNEVYDSENKAAPRLVDHEDLVYYANLETFIIPRTKLAIGESFDSPVVNTTIATIFGGEENLKINFLKPKGKSAFDTSWSDQLTGKESRTGRGANQKSEQVIRADGSARFKNSVTNYEDTQLLGIKSIRVNIKGTGVPEVNIEMVDIQGRSLFEQGENSLYSAFFNFPYPLFYLTLKGYYGKAIRYRLSLMSFNSKFDADTGNYNISLKLVGKFTALLFDTPLQYAQTAPKMFDTQITVTDPKNGVVRQLSTYKGRQKLEEVYKIYKRKGLIDEDFDEISIDEFKYRVNNFTAELEKGLKEKSGDFTQLNDVQDYRDYLEKLKKEVYQDSLNTFLDNSSYYVVGDEIFYPFRKEISDQSREDFKTKINDRITNYVNFLNQNATFGNVKGAKRTIPVTIKNNKDVIKKLDLNAWLTNTTDLLNTYYYRNGRQLDPNNPNDLKEFEKFKLNETQTADLTSKVKNEKGEFVDDTPDYFVFGDKRVDDGLYKPKSYLSKLDEMSKTLLTFEESIENELSKKLADKTLLNPKDGGIGFTPTIRNVFAVIFAGADAFYRLMDETHQTAWNVRNDPARLLAVIPPEKSFSVDAVKNLQTASGTLNNDNVVYPWPLYFTLEKQKDGRELYTIQYPGDPSIIKQTKAYDYRIWPEISFVEAYLKGVTEKPKPVQGNIYENPNETTLFVSANALEFPFTVLPYQDLDAVKTFYEIFERSYVSSYYGKFINKVAKEKQVDKFYGDIESSNISLVAPQDISINQTLKELKLNLPKLLDYMKKISNNGNGESWQTYLRSLFKTEYIENMLKTPNQLYSIDTLSSRSIKVSADQPLVENLNSYIKGSESSQLHPLDSYPFTDTNWLTQYLSNGVNLTTYDDFNGTYGIFTYLGDKRTISRINESEDFENIKLFTTYNSLNNGTQPYVTDQSTDEAVISRQTLKDFYTNRNNESLFVTESFIDYGTSYSGNVGLSIQTTSLLNTPYFINSIIEGVELKKSKTENAFASLGYLYLNSLPLITTKERLVNLNDDGTVTDLDYLASTLKKYSAIHQVPYAWVLKYGSIWYRYKKFINEGVDILDSVWKDFDYVGAYDPIFSSTTTEYTILNYTGGQQSFVLQKTELFPIPSIQSKDILNTGFYPKVINSVNNFIFDKDLFTGYTVTDFDNSYNNDKFRIGRNLQSSNYLNFGFDSANINRSLLKLNYFQFREFSGNSYYDNGGPSLVLYPSMGGIPIDQSIYECVNDTDILTKELLNNKSLYNGSVRSLWGSSHFGYFDKELIKKPLPTEYLKVIKTNTTVQNPFDLTNNQSKYSSIDEIFNVFTVDVLDKFEEQFLGFCNDEPKISNLVLKDEILAPTYTETSKISNLKEKRLYSQIRSMFVVTKTGVDFVSEDVDGETLGVKQMETFTKSVESFLNFDCVLKLGNPTNFDRKLFNSFSNLVQFVPVDKYVFAPYTQGTLPGDGTSVTLLQSVTQNRPAWNSLRKYLGFSLVPSVDYPNQVISAFPSVTPYVVPVPTPPATPLPVNPPNLAPTPITSYSTFVNLCDTTEYFNLTDTNGVTSLVGGYLDNEVYYLDVTDSNGYQRQFCARKSITASNAVNNYNLVVDSGSFVNVPNSATECIAQVFNGVCPPQTQILPIPFSIPTLPQQPPVVPLLGTQKSVVSDFFIDNDIAFTVPNIETLYPLIRIYAEQKLKDSTFNKTKFTTYINNYLLEQSDLQNSIVNETFSNLNRILKDIKVVDQQPNVAVNGNTGKLSLYNTLKGFNDKWIAGSDLKSVTLFEDFLFMDKANSDIGDTFIVDMQQVVNRLDTDKNPDMNLMQVVSNILTDNEFMFMAMPAYINFYGIQESIKNGKPIDIEIPNSLFGTYLEVDYTKSSPKFLCIYMGNPSEYPKPKENSFNRFGDDSFDLRVPDNPLRISDPKRDYSKTNKVVGFSVDYGVQNQNIFKSVSLDMSEMKNTSESFKVFADLGNSVAGDKVAQQSTSMYSIYKSRSYSCGVEAMGNVMIQPTMYFILRHVPMFYGPYWIYEVNHNVTERGFETDFKGTRIPKYSLPQINNLITNVNKKILKGFKDDIKKSKPEKDANRLDLEKQLSTNPEITKNPEIRCDGTAYPSIPFVDLLSTPFTEIEIIESIKSTTNKTHIRALLLGIAKTRTINDYKPESDTYNGVNYNPYGISTLNKFNGNMSTYIVEQSCIQANDTPVPLAKFANLASSCAFMVSYYNVYDKMIMDLKVLNSSTNESLSYGKSLAQIISTTWDTAAALGDTSTNPPQPPLNAKGIKDYTLDVIYKDKLNSYNTLVSILVDSYDYFVQNPN